MLSLSIKKHRITTLLLSLIIIILIIITFSTNEKLGKLEQTVDGSLEKVATNQVSDAFRRYEHNDVLVEGLYYFDALASLREDDAISGISSRLLRYTEKESFHQLKLADTTRIADFLDLMYSDSPPTSDEVLDFMNFIVLKTE